VAALSLIMLHIATIGTLNLGEIAQVAGKPGDADHVQRQWEIADGRSIASPRGNTEQD
jgi:hypothetical protein